MRKFPSSEDTKLEKKSERLNSAERRNFLKLAGTGGFTAALVAGAAGTLWSTEAVAQTANEDRERENAAAFLVKLCAIRVSC